MPEEDAAPPSGREPRDGPADGAEPRAPEPEEFPSLLRMLDGVFRSKGGSMLEEFPRLLSETNRADLRVVVEGGEVVSHAGAIIRDASLSGACVRVALLGAVSTAEAARGKGHATKCVRAAAEHAAADGADYMIISGRRDLYTRLGSRRVGDDVELRVTARQAEGLSRDGIEVRPFGEKDLLDVVDLYCAEEVRFIRPIEDWRGAMRTGFVWCKKTAFLGAWEVGRLAAYALLHPPNEEGVSSVVEYGGARGVLVGALRRLMEYLKADKLKLHLGHQDRGLGARLAAAGIEGRTVPADGTTVVLNFEALMGKLRRRFLERAGETASRELSFSEEGPHLGPDNKFRIACGPDVIRIEGRGALAEFIFGTPGRSPEADASAGQLMLWGTSGPFEGALPAPTLLYGLNYT